MFSELIKRGRRRALLKPSAGTVAVDLHRPQIERMLPHRDPMLLVDSVDAVDLSARAIWGRRRVDRSDPVFAGHFPRDPVYPGVLLVEMIGQLGICLLHLLERGVPAVEPSDTPRPVRLLKVHHASFYGHVGPGDDLQLVGHAVDDSDYVATCAGQVLCGGEVKALALYEIFLSAEASTRHQ